MIAKYTWVFGSSIFVLFGTLHLLYTFFSNKFSSRNKNLIHEMQVSYPNLTKETTMWKAWIGFNASHSSGAMFIGIINMYLVHQYFMILANDPFFWLFNILTVSFYWWLAKRYWFKIPFIGISITLLCYLAAYILILIK